MLRSNVNYELVTGGRLLITATSFCSVSFHSFISLLKLVILLVFFFTATSAASEGTNEIDTANVFMESGFEHYQSGRFPEALKSWNKAYKLYTELDDSINQSKVLVRKAEAYIVMGKIPNAILTLQESLAHAEESGHKSQIIPVLAELGTAYHIAGQFEESQRIFDKCIELANETNNQTVIAIVYNNLGNLFVSKKEFTKAIDAFKHSNQVAMQNGETLLSSKALVNAARVSLESGQKSEALKYVSSASKILPRMDESHDKAYILISIGNVYLELMQDQKTNERQSGSRAYKAFEEAINISERKDDALALSYALGYMAQLYEYDKRYQEALHLTQRAAFAAQQINASDPLYRWQRQKGSLLKSLGNIDDAINSYRQAVYTIQSIRTDLSIAGRRKTDRSLRHTVRPVFFEYADLLLQSGDSTTDPKQEKEYLIEAREVIEQLKATELEDYFQDDCVAELQSKIRGIDQLDSKTAALYPIILKDRLSLLLSLPNSIKQYVIDIDEETLTNEIRSFRKLLEKRTTYQYLTHAKIMYSWLIDPILNDLRTHNIDTIVIIPDGPLRTIPLAALYDGRQYLIEQYAIATTPGLTLTDPRHFNRENIEVLLTGLTEPVQGFDGLPKVAEEFNSIQSIFPSKILMDKEFKTENMHSELTKTPYSIVHIASHAQFNEEIEQTFLLTYDDRLSMNSLEEFLAISEFRDKPVELLTLSACQTAVGDDRAALGLAGVAIKAGARSALATLWFINDRASSILVSRFYQGLADPSLTKAKALQQAQLKSLEDKRYKHAAYWSPFLLIGNWL